MDKVVDTASTGDLAAVILEPYQGGAGFIFPPEGWLTRVQDWCRDRGVLFIVDEVQASFGRTGKLFAIEHEGLRPNLLCLGKGIGSGIPTAALMAEARIMNTFAPGEMSSTTGGNPVSCAAAHAVLDIMEEEKLVENSARIGAHMLARLRDLQARCEVLGDVRGKGLVMGLEFVYPGGPTIPCAQARLGATGQAPSPAPELTLDIIRRMCERGVICGRVGIHGNVIRVAPPLVITQEQADKSVDVLEEVLGNL
jgi:4-aminobutyrate aminotransferase-like enzyme